MANRMSLFYAQATPMLRVLSDTTSKFVSEVSIKDKLSKNYVRNVDINGLGKF